MPLIILKTDLKTDRKVEKIGPIFNLHPNILDWHVDTEDIDNVLRIVAKEAVNEHAIIQLLKQFNVKSQALIH